MDEEVLAGGVANAGAVTRIGEYVLRPSNAHTGSIHRFLTALHTGADCPDRRIRPAGFRWQVASREAPGLPAGATSTEPSSRA